MKTILTTVLLAAACHASAQTVKVRAGDSFDIERLPFGSGTPAQAVTDGTEPARHVADGLYHVPNYLPGFPTAATIWPRELPVECTSDAYGIPQCKGYEVLPAVGRGEYLFVRPVARVTPKPEVKPQPPAPAPAPAPVPVTRKKPLG